MKTVIQGFFKSMRRAASSRPAFPALHALVALAIAMSTACSGRPPDDPKDYAAQLSSERLDKDKFFQESSSPIPEKQRSVFLPLSYFAIDPEYNVLAGLKANENPPTIMMPTSTGAMRPTRQVGTLEFTLKGQTMSLVAVTEDDLNRLTVMFSDMTSGAETYPAGRYIDLNRTGSGIYALDFNRAYNPYCYYNPTYECPLPPPENRLKVPIRAGERMKEAVPAVPTAR